MAWIDCGINLTDPRFDIPAVLTRATEVDIAHMLVISSNLDETQTALDIISQQTFSLACTAGVHPHYADHTNSQTWAKLKALLADTRIVAVGECGLDFNRNFSTQKNQLYAFEQQLDIACEHQIGVYLHERDAFDHQVKLLDKYAKHLPFMVAHCFTGNAQQLNTYIELGCYIGVTGWLCDNKRGQDLQEAVKNLPLSRLLLETDGPYLFPKTLRPRKSVNEPCNIPFIGAYLAELIGEKQSCIEKNAFKNASKLFFNRGINDKSTEDIE